MRELIMTTLVAKDTLTDMMMINRSIALVDFNNVRNKTYGHVLTVCFNDEHLDATEATLDNILWTIIIVGASEMKINFSHRQLMEAIHMSNNNEWYTDHSPQGQEVKKEVK